MRGRIASPSAMANAYHTSLHNQSLDNIWTGTLQFTDTLQNNSHLACGQRTAVGSCPYNLSTAQNTEGIGQSLTPYGFGILATFAQIPTCVTEERAKGGK